jgi:hypothetical protein
LADEKGALAWKAFGMMHQGSLLALTGQASNTTELMNLDQFDAWRCIGEAMTASNVRSQPRVSNRQKSWELRAAMSMARLWRDQSKRS